MHTSISAVAGNLENNAIDILTINDSFEFSQPSVEMWGDYVLAKSNEADNFLREVGKPMLPVFRKVYTFPLGSKIEGVECIPRCIDNKPIPCKIKPSSNVWYIPAINGTPIEKNTSREIIIENSSIYSSSDIFPNNWYDYKINCGLEDGNNVVFLILSLYPVRYSPADNLIFYPSGIDVRITYERPVNTTDFSEQYDMVIITPSKFRKSLQPLIAHKNKVGVSTILKTTEEIYGEYSGRDEPEQIKYFIKDAKEKWNITYVLLVGGLKSYIYAKDKDDRNHGSTAWYVPVRYINTEIGYGSPISDFYYADIYRYNSSLGYEFEDWDSNGNNIFAEGNYTFQEEIDVCPDVHIGRLPCRNKFEIKTVVNKIIKYESTSSKDQSWFKRMISISGVVSTLIDGRPNGEVYCDKAIEYMGDIVEPVRIYASNGNVGGLVPTARDITREISKGSGFVHLEGHGNTITWGVSWPESECSPRGMTGINIYQLWKLFNGNKLPIIAIDGCFTSLFNVTLVNSVLSSRFGNKDSYWTGGFPTHKCLCWKLVSKVRGGAIATIGYTASESMSPNNPYVPIGFSTSCELNYDFFYQIGRKNVTTLGNAYSGAICKVVKENPIRSYEAHCIMSWQILGDPSLKIGGYNLQD